MSLNLEEKISSETVKEHGLTDDEYQKILDILGREPSLTELGVFSVMWSEHCSYKSSLKWLKTLHTSGKQVIQGPGENAGVVDIGDNQAIIFKMESHNHPSFIEPYQGAATGVGGILRDVFTMGARPIALMNALRFGEVDNEKTAHLLAGVVAGIGGYGNCMGIPTIGGEVNFHASYNGNILVNAMCIGLAEQDKIFYCAATGVGNPIIYVGSKTGRDGIHGATMASAEFDDDSQEKRPTVQVGDPFTEKLLLEACLELMQKDVIIGIQDMGAAGLTSSSVEMADKGNVGIVLELDKVPCRETHMSAYEMLLSESQERMLMVLKPGSEDEARAIFEKWDLNFEVIGHTTDTNHFVAIHQGEVKADIPLSGLASAAPCYERPWEIINNEEGFDANSLEEPADYAASLLSMLKSPDLASRRAIWEQYDHMVMGDTIQRPGGDSGVVRIFDTHKGLAISTDCTPRYCYANPYEGGKQAVVETYRNIIASGAKPLAITNCLNFGNPERKDVMGQFVGVINGMRDACKALDYPVVSGNVSLYNETNGKAILPTPTIGGIGLIADIDKMMDIKIKNKGDLLLVLGDEKALLDQSLYLREMHGLEKGIAPITNLEDELKLGNFVLDLIDEGLINAAHDISDGGLYIAVAEMAMASKIGADIKLDNLPDGLKSHPKSHILYGEEQGRYLVGVSSQNLEAVLKKANDMGIACRVAAETGGDRLSLDGDHKVSIDEMIKANEELIPLLVS